MLGGGDVTSTGMLGLTIVAFAMGGKDEKLGTGAGELKIR